MVLVAQRTVRARVRDRRRNPPLRHPRLAAATALTGAALAVLAARDGTPVWQLARVLAVASLAISVLAAQTRLGEHGCGRLAVAVGALALSVGAGFLPYVVKEPLSFEAAAGTVASIGGIVLAAAGTVLGTRGRRRMRIIAAVAGTTVVCALVASVVGPAVAATNVPRPEIGAAPSSKGLTYESVAVTTGDAVRLAGWYLPSTNRAAVVLLHGAGSTRSDVLDEAAVLAGHGFGVLLIDARGHGESGGRAMDFGWYGDADVAAATGYLATRPDVDRQRIGVVGMSMGGEEAIGAGADNELIRAVVAEGATGRGAADDTWLSDRFGFRGFLQEQLERMQDVVTDAFTDASPPTSLRRAVETSGDTRFLLIAAGDVADESHAAAYLASGAPDRVQTWTVPGAGHTAGLRTDPEAWEAHVVGFLTESLGT